MQWALIVKEQKSGGFEGIEGLGKISSYPDDKGYKRFLQIPHDAEGSPSYFCKVFFIKNSEISYLPGIALGFHI